MRHSDVWRARVDNGREIVSDAAAALKKGRLIDALRNAARPFTDAFKDFTLYNEQARPRLANNVAPVDDHARLNSLDSLPAFPHALYDSAGLHQGSTDIRVVVETAAALEHVA